jgi:uncharacterized membrane protein YeaQ/YmgE (transglycosylase-associated protein family)
VAEAVALIAGFIFGVLAGWYGRKMVKEQQ